MRLRSDRALGGQGARLSSSAYPLTAVLSPVGETRRQGRERVDSETAEGQQRILPGGALGLSCRRSARSLDARVSDDGKADGEALSVNPMWQVWLDPPERTRHA